MSTSGEVSELASHRKRNYKLLVDPELDPSEAKKVYRFNGVLPGVSTAANKILGYGRVNRQVIVLMKLFHFVIRKYGKCIPSLFPHL